MPSGIQLVAAGVGVVAGSALQLQQAALWTGPGYAALAAAALVGGALGLRRGGRSWVWALGLTAAALAFATTGLRAGVRLAEALPEALEGQDLEVVGIVDDLPRRVPEAWRFRFEVESAQRDGRPLALPRRLALGWYAQGEAALPELRAGQRWRLTLRLKRPHGQANPWGFDRELQLFEQGVRATGYVRSSGAARNERLDAAAGRALARARQAVREAIEAQVPGPQREAGVFAALDAAGSREAGVLAALAVGDQAAIEREDWALYRATGVAHLMSISGLHVTMFAWLAGLAIGRLWRMNLRALQAWPAPVAAHWGGLSAALAYAVFAGWGVPAQRTVLMLAVTVVIGAAGLRWRWPLVWGAAMVVVTAADPWALLQPGFWLSFVAVGLLLASGQAREAVEVGSGVARAAAAVDAGRASVRRRPVAALRAAFGAGLRTQAVATLGLAPLTLVFFHQLSLVGFAANLVAIPLVTLLVTPLALLGVLWAPLWSAAAALVQGLNALLAWLASAPLAIWSVGAAPPWAVAAGLLGGVLAVLPLPWRVRLLSLSLMLPLLAPPLLRPPAGSYELLAVDVGQGSAVLVRTATHALLYDTGPRYAAESDAGERVLLPLLRAQGERRLDMLMVSHRDHDHAGGAAALIDGLPVGALSSSLQAGHPLLDQARRRGAEVSRCQAGQRWSWDGVDFALLHPSVALLDRAVEVAVAPNALSCVLQIRGRWGGREQRALLAGDIERAGEASLVAAFGEALRSEVLLLPHHGSKTSSTAGFLDAVAPRVAVVQAGYRNRFGHPAAEVMQRLHERGIAVVQSPRCGAWRHGPAGTSCWRGLRPRYWQHPDGVSSSTGADNGVEVAIPPRSDADG